VEKTVRILVSLTIICSGLVFLTGTGSFSKVLASSDLSFHNVCLDANYCKDLSIQWWKWAYSFGKDSPIWDTTGSLCANGQSGPVWFLAGSFKSGEIIERNCTIPKDKTIFFPILNSNCSKAEQTNLNGNDFINCAKDAQDKARNLVATITTQNKKTVDLPHVRIVTSLFNFTIPADSRSFENVPAGTYVGAGNGEFVGISGLPVGSYVLKFSGKSIPDVIRNDPGFTQDVTYNLNIK
jgi:hypothetical protein